jgi:hypothetical protein
MLVKLFINLQLEAQSKVRFERLITNVCTLILFWQLG